MTAYKVVVVGGKVVAVSILVVVVEFTAGGHQASAQPVSCNDCLANGGGNLSHFIMTEKENLSQNPLKSQQL